MPAPGIHLPAVYINTFGLSIADGLARLVVCEGEPGSSEAPAVRGVLVFSLRSLAQLRELLQVGEAEVERQVGGGVVQ